MADSKKTIAFLGASTGCGFFAMKRALADGHTCIALLRNPSKLDAVFGTEGSEKRPENLVVKQGNAKDAAAVATILTSPTNSSRLVDAVYFSVGAAMNMWTFSLDDPKVCREGAAALIQALKTLREEHHAQGQPLLIFTSTTGLSAHGRDVPLLLAPLYYVLLHQAHADKRAMEERAAASGERFVIVRASLLVDGKEATELPARRPVRVGIEDLAKGWEKKELGYTISRADTGRWVYEELLREEAPSWYENKAVTVTW